jgi:hypothetical protein
VRSLSLFIILFFTPLCAELYLNQEFHRAEVGDYMVTHQNRSCTVMLVRAADENRLLLEEITVPTKGASHAHVDWYSWIQQGAPGHSSWVVYSLSRETGQMEASYSYSKRGWLDVSQSGQFFGTLLGLSFYDIPMERRKKLGGNPGVRMSHRPIWQPPLVFEGSRQRGVPFAAYEALWPLDGTELAGRRVTIYLPAEEGGYPDYFPYWIEVNPGAIENKVRVVDSGKHLDSPQDLPSELG